jgi:hypothetical protein
MYHYKTNAILVKAIKSGRSQHFRSIQGVIWNTGSERV